ncbi:hypothetical protein HY640_03600 [Candidatus Woesearchaeota archaeon]|nr:hypothetical protein [Candidatus Woesearchaeota archaeon]
MNFSDFIEQGKVRKGSPDSARIKSLMETSNNHLRFLKDQKIDNISAASILVTYYEALREIVEAVCLKDGFKVYSHEAFTYFLKEKGEPVIALKFDSMRKLRNAVNYYGENVSINEAMAGRKDSVELIKEIKEKFLDEEPKGGSRK